MRIEPKENASKRQGAAGSRLGFIASSSSTIRHASQRESLGGLVRGCAGAANEEA